MAKKEISGIWHAYLKNNMNDYLGRNKTEKESVIGAIKKHKAEERRNPKGEIRISKEAER